MEPKQGLDPLKIDFKKIDFKEIDFKKIDLKKGLSFTTTPL